jgi:hypothetical protein
MPSFPQKKVCIKPGVIHGIERTPDIRKPTPTRSSSASITIGSTSARLHTHARYFPVRSATCEGLIQPGQLLAESLCVLLNSELVCRTYFITLKIGRIRHRWSDPRFRGTIWSPRIHHLLPICVLIRRYKVIVPQTSVRGLEQFYALVMRNLPKIF